MTKLHLKRAYTNALLSVFFSDNLAQGSGRGRQGKDMPATSGMGNNYPGFPQGLVTSCLIYLWKSYSVFCLTLREQTEALFRYSYLPVRLQEYSCKLRWGYLKGPTLIAGVYLLKLLLQNSTTLTPHYFQKASLRILSLLWDSNPLKMHLH